MSSVLFEVFKSINSTLPADIPQRQSLPDFARLSYRIWAKQFWMLFEPVERSLATKGLGDSLLRCYGSVLIHLDRATTIVVMMVFGEGGFR